MQKVPTRRPRPLSHPGRGAAALLVCCCLMLTSCAPPSVSVRALSPVNLNADGESLPVKIRIYALRDDARFRAAPFADLWTKDREVLGDDRLQDPKVVMVAPASLKAAPQQVELSELPKEARFLGIVALIQHADQPDRRRVVIARQDIGSQIIDLVDSSIVMHDRSDPVPGRTSPREEEPVASPVAKSTAAPASTAPPAPTSAPAPAPAPPPAPAAPVASAAPAASAGTPVAEAPPANAPAAGKPGNQAATSGKSSAGRGRGTSEQGQ
jgi:type VI secretion system VasD/TssJ family lipoprotein